MNSSSVDKTLYPPMDGLLCAYPTVLPSCTVALGDIIEDNSLRNWRLTYLILGSIFAIASLFQLVRTWNRGTDIQRGVLPFVLIASLVIAIRSYDPNGLKGNFGIYLGSLTTTIPTAALCSVIYAIVMVWTSLFNSFGSRRKYLTLILQGIGVLYIICTWICLLGGGIARLDRPEGDWPFVMGLEFAVLIFLELTGLGYMFFVGTNLLRKVKQAGGHIVHGRFSQSAKPSSARYGRTAKTATSKPTSRFLSFARTVKAFFLRQSKLVYIMAAFTALVLFVCAVQMRSVIIGFNGTATIPWYDYNRCVAASLQMIKGNETTFGEVNSMADCQKLARFAFDSFFLCQAFAIAVLLGALWPIPPTDPQEHIISHFDQQSNILTDSDYQPSPSSSESVSTPSTYTHSFQESSSNRLSSGPAALRSGGGASSHLQQGPREGRHESNASEGSWASFTTRTSTALGGSRYANYADDDGEEWNVKDEDDVVVQIESRQRDSTGFLRGSSLPSSTGQSLLSSTLSNDKRGKTSRVMKI